MGQCPDGESSQVQLALARYSAALRGILEFMPGQTSPVWPLLVYFLAVVGMVAAVLLLSHVLGQRHRERATGIPYESGMMPTGSARLRLSGGFLPDRDVLRHLRSGDRVHFRLGGRRARDRLGRLRRGAGLRRHPRSRPSPTCGARRAGLGSGPPRKRRAQPEADAP